MNIKRTFARRPRTGVLAIVLALLEACQAPRPISRPGTHEEQVPQPQAKNLPEPVSPSDTRFIAEDFKGHHRSRAKTEYVKVDGALAPMEEFSSLESLKTFLTPQTDQIMRYRYPHLSKAATDANQRVAEERHNVSVTAYIHAVKHETGLGGDNDFHVILGSSPIAGTGIFLTSEASGLPVDGLDRDRFSIARQELLGIVGTCHCDGHFRQMLPPIPVRVRGSLFFDGEHATGTVGPKYAKPFTVWEIHPILTIERLQ